jgi:SsrA-binding protein
MALIQNKKIGFDYEILQKLEAGIQLLGTEAKSLRAGHGAIAGAHVSIRGDEAYLVGADIPPFQPKNTPSSYDRERARKLLLTKKEIAKLLGIEKEKGLTIVPVSVYNKGKNIKIELAVVRGKKKYDKRETLRKKDAEMDIRRSLKRNVE